MTMKRTLALKTLALAAAGGLMLATPLAAQNKTAVPLPGGDTAPAARAVNTAPRSWTDQEYRLGAGDKLRVEVYREPQLSQSLQVRPDGKISLPLVGDITASGQTAMELRNALSAALKEYVTNPVVTVIVTDALAAQVYVIGEVATPGAQVMQGPMTVLQALAQAGGLKDFANKGDIRVLRRGANGTTTTLPFDYKEALKGRVEPMPLQPGDTVVVP